MTSIQSGLTPLEELDLANKRVLVRADLDVGGTGEIDRLELEGKVAFLTPTLRALEEKGAKIILLAHRGRPKGRAQAELGMEAIGAELAEKLGYEILLPDDCIGEAAHKAVLDLRPHQAVLLENLRFHAEEERGDETFARRLAELGDVYVNEALGASNRPHASIVHLPRLMPERAVGLGVKAELAALERVTTPQLPMAIFLGGTRLGERGTLIERLLGPQRSLLLGGLLGCTFLAAKGHEMGRSRIDPRELARARTLLEQADRVGTELVLPQDLVVASSSEQAEGRNVAINGVSATDEVVDLGSATRALYRELLRGKKTALWIGAMGQMGNLAFSRGTEELALALCGAPPYSVVMGQAAVNAARRLPPEAKDAIGHICMGGGASLELVEHRRLPGIEALRVGG